ncbi:MAG: class I SAM-dependent methyltransferase [Candidatus Hinthialibacter antarcticus]|nr:class I SAM-dependent methyltransferase [Candidatus Hinthialibacter antarcticus]
MGQEINLLDQYPQSKRPIDDRAKLITEDHRAVARKFDVEYFDGDRLTGYGGYGYNARFWTDTVKRFRDHYQLPEDARILDVGCAKGFMMYDLSLLMPKAYIRGIDVSKYAYDHAHEEMKPFIQVANANNIPFEDDSFDLVICINTIHNLPPIDCKQAFREIQRVTRKDAFVMNDAWRNEAEHQSMLNWNLTALTYMHVDDWKKLFDEVGYKGDYYWFIAESA